MRRAVEAAPFPFREKFTGGARSVSGATSRTAKCIQEPTEMAVLQPTEITGTVRFLGLVPDREAALGSQGVDRVDAEFTGFVGEAHSGLVRPSCSRVKAQYPVGTPIRNTRQISILSTEDLAAIAAAMGLDTLCPEWLGASMVLEGIPEFTTLPPSSRLVFDTGAALCVDMENAPCLLPAREIERHHPGKGAAFRPAARGRRGVTAWVEAEGTIRLGDRVRLHVPPQRLYRPLQAPPELPLT
jgi:hypothetical protein